jgi:hypothetical protein
MFYPIIETRFEIVELDRLDTRFTPKDRFAGFSAVMAEDEAGIRPQQTKSQLEKSDLLGAMSLRLLEFDLLMMNR